MSLNFLSESLLSLDPIASSGGFDPDIFKAMRNLSAQLEQVAARGRAAAEKAEPLLFKKVLSFSPDDTKILFHSFVGTKKTCMKLIISIMNSDDILGKVAIN